MGGGLVFDGPIILDRYRQAADYVDRILKAAKPATCRGNRRSGMTTAFDVKTANPLVLDPPRIMLRRAAQVIG